MMQDVLAIEVASRLVGAGINECLRSLQIVQAEGYEKGSVTR